MKVVVFGATGRVGRKLVSGGIARGHEVTAAARHPEDVRARHRIPRIVPCDLLDSEQVDAAVRDQDAVIVSVRARWRLAPGEVHSRGVANVLTAMESHAVRRLLCVSAVGTGDEHDPNLPPWFTRVYRPLVLSRVWSQLRAMEELVSGSGLDWTLVHVARLTDGPALGQYRLEEGDSILGGLTISRADLADFVLKELERNEWVGRHVTVAY
jgi:putative NADH-flavin reductase